jgi:rhodanese-related sulfurtransferase
LLYSDAAGLAEKRRTSAPEALSPAARPGDDPPMTTATASATSKVRRVEPAPAADAVAHFAARLTVETDCHDVDHDLRRGDAGIVVIDVRSRELFAEGHVAGAVNLPYADIDGETAAAAVPDGAVAVTYCAGPHCNAATQAALRLAQLGYPVKEMIGGLDYWRRSGYPMATGA